MADLISHSLLAYAVAARAPTPRASLWFVAGTVLPDAISRLPALALHGVADLASIDVPDPLFLGFDVLHTPVPYLLLCWLLALLAPAASRFLLFRCLALGGALHIAVDVLQRHLGGSYRLGYPFTLRSWEAGVFWTEDSIYAIPVLVPLALAVGVWRRRTGRSTPPGGPRPAAAADVRAS